MSNTNTASNTETKILQISDDPPLLDANFLVHQAFHFKNWTAKPRIS